MLNRRNLLKLGGVAAAVSVLDITPRSTLAHEDHGAAADLAIEVGEFFYRVVADHGNEVENPVDNGEIHIHAGRPHLIHFMNVGQVEHEIHFGQDVVRGDDGNAIGYGTNLFDSWLGLHLEPGQMATLHFDIPAENVGEWEIGCFIPGHYDAGQHTVLHVEAPEEEGHHDD